MKLFTFLSWACLFTAVAMGVTVDEAMPRAEPELPMKNDGPFKEVWVAAYDIPEDQDVNLEDLHRIASAHFNWLVRNVEARKRETDYGNCLVSALWFADERKVYVATKAKGNLHEQIMSKKERRMTYAPVWSGRVGYGQPDKVIRNRIFHAEDTVYFWAEWQRLRDRNPLFVPTKDENGKPTDIDDGNRHASDVNYPPGSMVATWGYYKDSKPSEKRNGRPIELCPSGGKWLYNRDGCQVMANSLGLEWAHIGSRTEEQVEQDTNVQIPEAQAESDVCMTGGEPGESSNQLAKRQWTPRGGIRHYARNESCSTTISLETEPMEPTVMSDLPEPVESGSDQTTGASNTTATITSFSTSAPTESPKPTTPPEIPKCFMQNALPDQFTSAFCRCTLGDETETLPLLTVESATVISQSCDYTTIPTQTENPVTEVTVTYTAGCSVCAGPGGVANGSPSWCTAIPGCVPPRPTYALYLSDTSVSLGTATNEDDGVKLGEALVEKIKEHCPEDEDQCDTEPFEVIDVPLIINEGIEYMVLEAVIDDSKYNSTSSRDYMLYSAVAGLVKSASETCADVDYEDEAEYGESGCGEGPIEKRHPAPPVSYWDRGELESSLGNMCTGPKVITAILGTQEDPYLNNLGMSFKLIQGDEGGMDPIAQWFCEAIVSGLALAAVKYMPKLPGFEAISEVEDFALEAICGES